MSVGFVHLHNHSEYSMLDGASKIKDIVNWAAKNNAPAVALTDHGNMFGAWDFHKTARDAGINPIMGCEVYIAPHSRHDKEKNQSSSYHLTLLAENNEGYANLVKMCSIGYTEGFYYRPRIDMEVLRQHREGIIVLTGCIAGKVPSLLCSSNPKAGVDHFKELIDIIPEGNLFVEVQNHWIDKELEAYPRMVQLADEFDLPIVGTNDCHYTDKDDHEIHDMMLCIQMKKAVSDEDRMKFENQFYYKGLEEMKEALSDFPPEALKNTLAIAKRCNVKLEKKDLMPLCTDIELQSGLPAKDHLKNLCIEGLKTKGYEFDTELTKRLEMELDIIDESGFTHYFLIVRDYANFAHEKGYPLSARGSAAGSLVLYALDVINFNPMDHGCIFERFLNLERINPPDIDIDFDDRSRDLVVEYLKEKYGDKNVAKVATYSSLNIRAAISDVARSLSLPHGKIKLLTKLSNKELTESLKLSVAKIMPEEDSEKINKLCELSQSLVGTKRHVSSHPSAVVISDKPLVENVPVFTDKHGTIATQFDGKTVEDIGMIKFDFLGSRSLGIAHDCLELINNNHDKNLKITDIPFDDEKTYNLIAAGFFAGIFQLEGSAGIRRIAMQVEPRTFDEFTAIPALYRPGPLQSGMAQKYIDRKHGRERVEYIHEKAENSLKDTYGVCVYQEQVMQMARDLAGYTLAEADVLRYAIGKKIGNMLDKERNKFVEGCEENGLDYDEAQKIFDILEPFGQYAFNKSHSVAYAMLAYRMCYMKANYPHEFLASVMSSSANEKIARVIDESKSLAKHLDIKIEILHPCVNESSHGFTCLNNTIRFGLNSVKGLTSGAIQSIIEERRQGKYKSFHDFVKRVDAKKLTGKVLAILASSGALDSFEHNRATIASNSTSVAKKMKSYQKNPLEGQMTIFGAIESEEQSLNVDKCKEWDDTELLSKEREVLGIYLSAHPLEKHSEKISHYISCTIDGCPDFPAEKSIYLAGTVEKKKDLKTKRTQSQMCKFELQDLTGNISCVVFPDKYRACNWIQNGDSIIVEGKLEEENTQVNVSKVTNISKIDSLATCLEIKIERNEMKEKKLEEIKEVIKEHKGDKRIILHLKDNNEKDVIAIASEKFSCDSNENLIDKIGENIGKENIYASNLISRLSI